MTGGARRAVAAWLEAGRKTGFFLLLLSGSAGLGLLIAWPLWLFATSQREAYTITVLCCAGAGIVALAVRTARRSRRAPRDPGRPRRTLLSRLATLLFVLVLLACLYIGAVFFYRGLWILAVPVLILGAGLLWLLGLLRRAAMRRARTRAPMQGDRIPAENKGE